MKKVNKVHLDGGVASCRVVPSPDSRAVAEVLLYTLYPAGAESRLPSERYGKMYHRVRVVGEAGDAGALSSLRDLESRLKDGPSGRPECRSVDGELVSVGDVAFVECPLSAFRPSESLKVQDNNLVEISGSVLECSHTDRGASVTIQSGRSRVTTFISREINQGAWEMVSQGRLPKGEAVLLKGPMLTRDYTDGRKTISATVVSVHEVRQLRREVRKGNNPTLG